MGEAQASRNAEAADAKMAQLAELARPLQHDFNNLLTVVYANLEMLRRTAAEGAPRRQLDRVEEATRRLEATSRAFLSFVRRPPIGAPAPVTLTEAVGSLRPLLQMVLPVTGFLLLDLEPEAWTVRLDRALFDRAMIDLAAAAAREGAAPGSQERLALVATNRPDAGGADAAELLVRARFAIPDGAAGALLALADGAGGRLAMAEDRTQLRLFLPRIEPPPAEAVGGFAAGHSWNARSDGIV